MPALTQKMMVPTGIVAKGQAYIHVTSEVLVRRRFRSVLNGPNMHMSTDNV